MVKILCLHGLGQTGNAMLKQLKPLIQSLPSDWQFIAPDAPNAMPGLRDFDYMGGGNKTQVSSLSSSASQPAANDASKPSKEKSKAYSLAIQAISVQIAAQAEYDGDQLRSSPWSVGSEAPGSWSKVMKSYIENSQSLVDAVPEVKEVYEDWKRESKGEEVEQLWRKLEDLSGRKGRKFPRSFSIQGEGWKGKGEWVGYSTSLKLFAKLMTEQGPVSDQYGLE